MSTTTDENSHAVAGQVGRGVRPAVAEAVRLAHAYADAKLMRYGMLNIANPPDPQAAFDALEAAIDAVVTAERERCAKLCDELHDAWRWDDEPDSDSGPRACAAAIRGA